MHTLAPSHAPLSYTSAELKILVVEDESGISSLLTEIFRAGGHRVGVAVSVEEGWQKFSSEAWHLVCIGRFESPVNEVQLGFEIKRSSPATPIVLISYAPRRAGAGSFDVFLPKPFTCAALAEAVSEALRITPGLSQSYRPSALSRGAEGRC